MSKFYYVTPATGQSFINDYTKYAVFSLLFTGVDPKDIHVIGRTKQDIKIFNKLFGERGINIHEVNVDLSRVKWKVFSGCRKYSYFKAYALYHAFPEPQDGRCMIQFDGDVLWYKDPEPFFDTKCSKTWFHHGKALNKRSVAGKKGLSSSDIDPGNIDSISKWCSLPQAYLMAKWGAKVVPDREVVAGLYLLHPKDHDLLKWTWKGCSINADKFSQHEGAGEQKPLNAALAYLEIDWHGGSRFFCPEHEEYFDHFFGKNDMKSKFHKRAKGIMKKHKKSK